MAGFFACPSSALHREKTKLEDLKMRNQLLHIFRNTAFGRETLLQSAYFCDKTGTTLKIYIPRYDQFLMYFPTGVVTVHLDKAFMRAPKTAAEHAAEVITSAGLDPEFLEPQPSATVNLPAIPLHFDYMCCPRSISDLSSRIGPGHIGPKVRAIIQHAAFPVLIPTQVFKAWKHITVFFGGSHNAVKALKLGLKLSTLTGFPLSIFTQAQKLPKSHYRQSLEHNKLLHVIKNHDANWQFFEKGNFIDNLYDVPHDSLVVVGAYGHGAIRNMLFGNMMEKIQTYLPNNLLIVGPEFKLELPG